MNRPEVAVIDSDETQCQELCGLLQHMDYPAAPLHSLKDLDQRLQRDPFKVAIFDLDTMPVDNNYLRTLKKQYPDIFVLVISSRSYHPGLEEAMRSHIYACLAKPLDPDEIFFWLKSISENLSGSGEG